MSHILILTFKPAVESAWREDLVSHIDFEGWQYISNKDARNNNLNIDQEFRRADKSKPIVVFGSFQDLLGTNESGGIMTKNEFIHATNWDLVIFDEYHFGAWKERAKELFEKEDEESAVDFDAEKYQKDEANNAINESWLPISTKYYLFLSGTPFGAISSGEFIEEQIFNWTYSDEQRAKAEWKGSGNPYLALPRMVMLTYRMPDEIQEVAKQGEFDEFDLNLFFAAEGKSENARFKYENEVQKWLDLIRGGYLPASVDDLKLGQDKRPPMPFSDTRLLNVLSHTLWFLPNVASCFAMANLLKQRQNKFYHDYKVIVCAGTAAGIGLDALHPVQANMGDPLETKTITLTCGKLTTGVTVKPWTGIFMLRNLKSPETYFQAAFHVQSPWEVKNEEGSKNIMKNECYVFDFALDRALRQISDYSCRLDIEKLFYNQQSSMSEVDNSVYSRVAEPVETTRRAAKPVDSKPTVRVAPRSTVVQPQPVTMTIAPTLQEEQTKQEIEAKLESIGIDSNVIHKKFGKGMVVKINKNEKFIHIKFTLGEKKFIFPDAFLMGFLEVE